MQEHCENIDMQLSFKTRERARTRARTRELNLRLRFMSFFLSGPTEQLTDYNRIRGGMYWLRL